MLRISLTKDELTHIFNARKDSHHVIRVVEAFQTSGTVDMTPWKPFIQNIIENGAEIPEMQFASRMSDLMRCQRAHFFAAARYEHLWGGVIEKFLRENSASSASEIAVGVPRYIASHGVDIVNRSFEKWFPERESPLLSLIPQLTREQLRQIPITIKIAREYVRCISMILNHPQYEPTNYTAEVHVYVMNYDIRHPHRVEDFALKQENADLKKQLAEAQSKLIELKNALGDI